MLDILPRTPWGPTLKRWTEQGPGLRRSSQHAGSLATELWGCPLPLLHLGAAKVRSEDVLETLPGSKSRTRMASGRGRPAIPGGPDGELQISYFHGHDRPDV